MKSRTYGEDFIEASLHHGIIHYRLAIANWPKVRPLNNSLSISVLPRGRKYSCIHCKKELAVFPSPAGMSLIKLFLGGNNLVFSRPERVWSVTSRLGTGKWLTLFYSVTHKGKVRVAGQMCCRILANFSKKRPKRELCFSPFPQNGIGKMDIFTILTNSQICVTIFVTDQPNFVDQVAGKSCKLLATLSCYLTFICHL
jgi:hypothetical protein